MDVCIDQLMSSSLCMSNVNLARCGLSPTYHSLFQPTGSDLISKTLSWHSKPTRWYHSILFIQDSLDTRAFSHSLALYPVFNVPPEPRDSTAICC